MRAGLLKKSALKEVIVDTTVQEKNISYPTDGKLINKAREHLVEEAKREGISLRQSYKITGKKEKAQSDPYFHAKQYRRGKASVKKQRNWLGRVIRDIKRKCPGGIPEKLKKALELGGRIFEQERGAFSSMNVRSQENLWYPLISLQLFSRFLDNNSRVFNPLSAFSRGPK